MSFLVGQAAPVRLSPIFDINPAKCNLLNQCKKPFEDLEHAGIHFSSRQLAALTVDQIQAIQQHSRGLADMRREGIVFSAQELLPLHADLISTIGAYAWRLIAFIREGFPFSWEQLPEMDVEVVKAVIENGHCFGALKNVAGREQLIPNLSWEWLTSLAAKDIRMIGKHGTAFAVLKAAGVEFSFAQYLGLTPRQSDRIGYLKTELAAFKKAEFAFSWEQLTAMDDDQYNNIYYNAITIGVGKYAQTAEENAQKVIAYQQNSPLTWEILTTTRLKQPAPKLELVIIKP